MKRSDELIIRENVKIKEAMKTIDRGGLGIVFIVDRQRRLQGTVTDGDIRKQIIKGGSIDKQVKEIMYKYPISVREDFIDEEVIPLFHSRDFSPFYSLKIPVLDGEQRIKDVIIYSRADNRIKTLNKTDGYVKTDQKKILVVGGAGYLGSILCRKLLKRGYNVRVLDIMMFGDESLSGLKDNDRFELIKGDVRNISTVTKALKDIDGVINLASIVGDSAGRKQPMDTIEINYLATMTLAQACKYHQINRFILASTCSVYGIGDKKLDEESELNPISLYARAKVESEKGILSLVDENFAPTIMRMGTIYGLSHRTRFDLVVNYFSMMATTEEQITVFGGDQWRPLLNVSDASEAYIKCLEAPIEKVGGEIFNVGSKNYQLKELADIIKKILPKTKIIYGEREIIEGKKDDRDYIVSFDKIKKVIDFKAVNTVEESIKNIHDAIKSGKIKNVKDPKYYNI